MTMKMMAVLILLAAAAFGQDRSSTIIGTVTDSDGRCVVDASVIVLDQSTNVSLGIKTDGAGEYTAPDIAPGKYTVVVEKDGFQRFRKTDIAVEPNGRVRVNAALARVKSARADQRIDKPSI
jgi:hypothetical protein